VLFIECQQLIPQCIQLGTAVGIGMITALAGATEIDLVVSGEYTIVDMGPITYEVVLSMLGFIIIAVALYYKIKGAFCITLVLNTIVWWTSKNEWPSSIVKLPMVAYADPFKCTDYTTQFVLTLQLFFLCLLTLSGLVRSMSDLCHLTRSDGTTPRNRYGLA
jgi:xanthine/uracil/vitamin C permease (AzgA family)